MGMFGVLDRLDQWVISRNDIRRPVLWPLK
jgi:hypothetical protein